MIDLPNDTIDLTPAQEMPRDVPVMGTEPVKASRKRSRRKPTRKARAEKTKQPDPILEASKASAPPTPNLQSAQPVEEAPTSTLLTDVGAAFVEARERSERRMFADARSTTAPPIKSTWAQRFVFGLRRMTGTDKVDAEPVRLSTTLTIILCFALVGTLAGVARAVM